LQKNSIPVIIQEAPLALLPSHASHSLLALHLVVLNLPLFFFREGLRVAAKQRPGRVYLPFRSALVELTFSSSRPPESTGMKSAKR
jgi:hypothetical protein